MGWEPGVERVCYCTCMNYTYMIYTYMNYTYITHARVLRYVYELYVYVLLYVYEEKKARRKRATKRGAWSGNLVWRACVTKRIRI